MKRKYINADSGEEDEAILGDFGFNPVAEVDGFGKSFPIPSKTKVAKEALKVDMYSNTVTVPVKQPDIKPVVPSISMEIDDSMKKPVSKPVMKTPAPTKPVPDIVFPIWAKAITYTAIPATMAIAYYRKSGVTGYVVAALVGALIAAAPAVYFADKMQKSK